MQQFRLLFGTYVQLKEPSTQSNSMQPRTRGAIALGTRGNSNDGPIFMALDTGKIIRRTHWTVHPVTDLVRRRVEELGSDEPRLLMTWFDRHGRKIGDGGMLWDSVQANAASDRNTRPVSDDIEESPESDLDDDADADFENQSTQLDVDKEDITGVDPHDEDVEESLDEYNQDFEDGDVNEQAIDEIQEESEIQEDSEIREDSDVPFSQDDSGGGSQRPVQPQSTMNQESTPAENG